MRGPIRGYAGHVWTAVLGLGAAFAIFVYLYIGGGGLDLSHKYKVDAVVPTIGTLTPGARVTMAGVKVGRVTKITRHGVGSEIQMELNDHRVTPLPADTRITVRQRTPVGENYVSLTPGRSAQRLASGSVLPEQQSDEYVDVDQILSVLRGSTRDRAREFIQSVGGALADRGPELNRLLGGSAKTMRSGAQMLRVLSGEKRSVAALVARLGSVSAAVGDSNTAIATIATKGLRSMQAVAARDGALRQTLTALPATLAQVRRTSITLGAVSTTATPVVADLANAVRELRPAVRTLRPAAQGGREVVRALSSAAPRLSGTLTRARSLAGPLTDALPQLLNTLCQVNPMVRYIKPYGADIAAASASLGSSANDYDAIGHLIRVMPIMNENSLVGLPEDVSRAAHTLMHAGFLSETSGLTWNPYPKPNMIGKEAAGPGNTIFGPDDLAKTGYKYPHVTPDC